MKETIVENITDTFIEHRFHKTAQDNCSECFKNKCQSCNRILITGESKRLKKCVSCRKVYKKSYSDSRDYINITGNPEYRR